MSSETSPFKTQDNQDIIDENLDDDIALPADTLAILQEFLKEQSEREKLLSNSTTTTATASDSVEDKKPSLFQAFEENWQLSQFWYNESTKEILANVCRKCGQDLQPFRIGLMSCPSLYESIRLANPLIADGVVKLFEYDERFSAYGNDFVHYDYNNSPITTSELIEFHEYFDLVIADPPFLSEECIEKISKIINYVIKPISGKIILCSGQVVEKWAKQFLSLEKKQFQPNHNRNLGNEFASYANFDLDKFIIVNKTENDT